VNEVSVRPLLGDLTQDAPPRVDMVLVGDLFYAPDLAARVLPFLDSCAQENIAVLIGDPRRAFLPRSRLELLAEYPGPDFGDAQGVTQTRNAVFRLKI
jgi:predicted nicotinamide N-methyase